jgi:hypothetical protein
MQLAPRASQAHTVCATPWLCLLVTICRTLRLSQQNFDQGLWWTEDIYNWNLVSHGA